MTFAADLYCGLGGWTEGFLAAGYRVFGFDNHRHEYLERVLPEPGSVKASGVQDMGISDVGGDSRLRSFNYANQCLVREAPLTGRIARYPGQLILQDALTIHGSQLKDAAVIVASPPCQKYSYLAMPWSKSKCPLCKGSKVYFAWQLITGVAPGHMTEWGRPIPCDCKENSRKAKELRAEWEKNGPDNRLFDACFRIQREAIEANTVPCPGCGSMAAAAKFRDGHTVCFNCGGPGMKSRYIPLIVENVRGAVPWVGKQQAQFGSFYLWGDVAQIGNRVVAGRDLADIRAGRGRFGMGVAPEKTGAEKVPGFRFDGSERSFQTASVEAHVRNSPEIPDSSPLAKSSRSNGGWFNDYKKDGEGCVGISRTGSKSNTRKAASAMIAKIPYALSRYIAEQNMPAERPANA